MLPAHYVTSSAYVIGPNGPGDCGSDMSNGMGSACIVRLLECVN